METDEGITSMSPDIDKEYPKRLFRHGREPLVGKVNNFCKTALLKRIKKAMPLEYKEVKSDPLFAHVFAIFENRLGYSVCIAYCLDSW
ncbi:hypothetical protein AtNW77_Chr3g0191281 [Arabidopsis thaliana]|uniref:Uncharacterized protein n=1 Tax=Arabidopsis thaliana TaxID=3702 RepID=A0A178VDK4_ARATH|nr:hypothetical protein AXX17_AT3G32650 [Arabidopsis thaliana]